MPSTAWHQPLTGYGRRQAAEEGFKPYPIGCFHIDNAEVRTEKGKLYLFVAIARTCKFAYAEVHQEALKTVAAQFLRNRIAAAPYQSHTVLTDNGIQFTSQKRDQYAFTHMFARSYGEHAIVHQLTKTHHPWTNGQIERMNRTLKEATDQNSMTRRISTSKSTSMSS